MIVRFRCATFHSGRPGLVRLFSSLAAVRNSEKSYYYTDGKEKQYFQQCLVPGHPHGISNSKTTNQFCVFRVGGMFCSFAALVFVEPSIV